MNSNQKHSQKLKELERERERERERVVMGGCCEAEFEAEESKIPRLPLFNPPPMHSPERSGMVTPPLHTSASVPFGWEEEPGKPRPCTALATFSSSSHQTPNNKCLELPPRLLLTDANLTKLPLPTTVLDGPYTRSEDCYGSSFSAERGQLGTMVLSKGKGFGFWRKKDFRVKHVFPSSADNKDDTNHNISTIIGSHHKNVRMRKMKHHGSFANPFHAKSGVWTKICEGWKRVIPWRGKNLNKYGHGCWWP